MTTQGERLARMEEKTNHSRSWASQGGRCAVVGAPETWVGEGRL